MPELFGIVASRGLSPDEISGFAAMERDLQAFRPGTVFKFESSFARIGVMSRYKLDHTTIETLRDLAVTICWVGTPPKRSGTTLEQIAKTVVSGGSFKLETLEPRWCCVIISEAERKCWLLSDRHGFFPMHEALSEQRFIFASKVPPILRSKLVDDRDDPIGLIDLLTFEHCTGDRTLVEAIRVMPPASIRTVSEGRASLVEYWKNPVLESEHHMKRSVTPRDLFEGLCDGVTKAVEDSERPAVTLSGGLDSRAILGAACDVGAKPETFTFGLPGCRDIEYAKLMADVCGVSHRVTHIDGSFLSKWLDYAVYVTGGMVGTVHFHILCLAETLHEHSDMVLDGMGGDALTGSHLKWGMVYGRKMDAVIDKLFAQRATGWKTRTERSRVIAPELFRESQYDPKDAIRMHFQGLSSASLWRGCHRFDLLERQRRFIQNGPQLLEPILRVETPFYTRNFFDQAMQLSPWQLLEQNAYLMMQRRHLGRLARIPDTARGLKLMAPRPLRFAKKVWDFGMRKLMRRIPQLVKSIEPGTTDYAKWLCPTGASSDGGRDSQIGLSPTNNSLIASETFDAMRNGQIPVSGLSPVLALLAWTRQNSH